MTSINVRKVTVNICVGDSTEQLKKAEKLLEGLLKQKPVRTYAKSTIPDFGIKKGSPIGIKVTLRKKRAEDFLKKAIDAVESRLKESQFDDTGNFSFGIREYINLPETNYDPDIGMFGMDVAVSLAYPGYRIGKRKIRRKNPKKLRISKEKSMEFIQKKFGVQIVE